MKLSHSILHFRCPRSTPNARRNIFWHSSLRPFITTEYYLKMSIGTLKSDIFLKSNSYSFYSSLGIMRSRIFADSETKIDPSSPVFVSTFLESNVPSFFLNFFSMKEVCFSIIIIELNSENNSKRTRSSNLYFLPHSCLLMIAWQSMASLIYSSCALWFITFA